ncbi:MAG TPA: hypothetical protein VME86_06825 [Acidobacteriaceae bacterium]|nr:hypothetical protein [Acidobacteriaceae bacterium]
MALPNNDEGAPGPSLLGAGEASYYDFNVHNQEKFQQKLRYIHRNPVKKELCARPED